MMEPDKNQSGNEHLNLPPAQQARECQKEGELADVDAPFNVYRISQKIDSWNEQVSREGWSISIPRDFADRPALQRGFEILQDSGAVIVGMSLGNSYFSPENITRLFRFLQSLNVEVYIAVMDKPSEHNYRALAYSEEKIAQKIKKKSSEIFRAIGCAFGQINDSMEHFHILDWESIRENEDYRHARESLEFLYSRSDQFRTNLRTAVENYMIPKLNGLPLTEEGHASADQYLMEELAFLICSRELLGKNGLAYLYHKEWSLYERLITGIYDRNLTKGLGFVELKVD